MVDLDRIDTTDACDDHYALIKQGSSSFIL